MTFNYSKLKGRIVEKYGTQKAFLERVNMSKTSFISKLKNRNHFTNDEILEIKRVLDIPNDEITEYFFNLKVKEV